VDVLDDQDPDPEAVKELGERPHQPMPGGAGVGQRFRRGRERVRPLGKQRPQRARQRRQPEPAQVDPARHRLPGGVDDRAERQPLAKRRADRDQPAQVSGPAPGADRRQGLPDQAALADAGLALHQHHRGEAPQRFRHAPQLIIAPDKTRDAHIGTAPQAATFRADPPR
jgi:hypothetical protein